MMLVRITYIATMLGAITTTVLPQRVPSVIRRIQEHGCEVDRIEILNQSVDAEVAR